MILKVFYSWQSDLPNSKNRSFIEKCIKKAAKNIATTVDEITEVIVESDSRGDTGTPDLIDSIFSKIDSCDIFICDISIINSDKGGRLVPNPNVLIELGYAAKRLGWNNIICLFNKEFANIEDLPFDIRTRKPLIYDTRTDMELNEKSVTSILTTSINCIFNYIISDKRYIASTKRTIDLGMQAILIDLTTLYFFKSENAEKYNYVKLLESTFIDIEGYINNIEFLGFDLFKNIVLNIDEFTVFVKDEISTFFLSEDEKKILIKLIYCLREYKEFLNDDNLVKVNSQNEKFKVISGLKMNAVNDPKRYILLEVVEENQGIVRANGLFCEEHVSLLLNSYKFAPNRSKSYVRIVGTIVSLINDWIKLTGNYFIVNHKLIKS